MSVHRLKAWIESNGLLRQVFQVVSSLYVKSYAFLGYSKMRIYPASVVEQIDHPRNAARTRCLVLERYQALSQGLHYVGTIASLYPLLRTV
ncbi:hypothetical protein D3C78_1044330 [compost metagenome]